MKKKSTKIFLLIILITIIIVIITLKKMKNISNKIMYTKIDNIEYSKEIEEKNNIERYENNIQEIREKEYQNMPEKLGEYKIIGKIENEKINLNQYILSETTEESLNLSVTKLYGPNVNKVGNFCIIGHNYINSKMFGNIKKLEIGDIIKITDTFDKTIEYKVYNIYTTNPKDTSCLSQETDGEREITLITCTFTGVNRLIVKAVENYD